MALAWCALLLLVLVTMDTVHAVLHYDKDGNVGFGGGAGGGVFKNPNAQNSNAQYPMGNTGVHSLESAPQPRQRSAQNVLNPGLRRLPRAVPQHHLYNNRGVPSNSVSQPQGRVVQNFNGVHVNDAAQGRQQNQQFSAKFSTKFACSMPLNPVHLTRTNAHDTGGGIPRIIWRLELTNASKDMPPLTDADQDIDHVVHNRSVHVKV